MIKNWIFIFFLYLRPLWTVTVQKTRNFIRAHGFYGFFICKSSVIKMPHFICIKLFGASYCICVIPFWTVGPFPLPRKGLLRYTSILVCIIKGESKKL